MSSQEFNSNQEGLLELTLEEEYLLEASVLVYQIQLLPSKCIAKAEQFSLQSGNMMKEDSTWRRKEDIGR